MSRAGIPLVNLIIEKNIIASLPWYSVNSSFDIRIYVEEIKNPLVSVEANKNSGYDFFVIQWVGGYGKKEDLWDLENEPYVQVMFWGDSRYDGLRHLFMGHEETDNEGCLYCPDPTDFPAIFSKIAELDKMFCQADNLHY